MGTGRQRNPDLEGRLDADAMDLQRREQAEHGLGRQLADLDGGLVRAQRRIRAGVQTASNALDLAAVCHARDRARRNPGGGQLARRQRRLPCSKAQQLGSVVMNWHAQMVAKCTTYWRVMHIHSLTL
jgi:hypothetical protein